MTKSIIICSIVFLSVGNIYAQIDSLSTTSAQPTERNGPVYKLKPIVDIPVTAAAVAWSLYAFPKIYDKPSSTTAEIQNLRTENINGFDRWAVDVYHESAAKTSDLLFYGSIPLPLLLFIDHDIRKDAAKIAFLYLETMSITGIYYTGSAYVWDRYRPYTYNTDPGPEPNMKTDGNAKNSFLGGHPALVATSTFFIAKVFSDYHPDASFKWVLYGGAALATGTTAYLRHRAGRHFPSDLLTGIAMGTLTGILVPHFHKNKQFKNRDVTILPFTGRSHGLLVRYKL